MKVTQSQKLMTTTSKFTTGPFQGHHNQTEELFSIVICTHICCAVVRIHRGGWEGERDGEGEGWSDKIEGGGEGVRDWFDQTPVLHVVLWVLPPYASNI